MVKVIRYSAIYAFPFLIMLGAGFALQLLVQRMEPGVYRTAVYAVLSLFVALGVSLIINKSQAALNMRPFFWGNISSLGWGLVIGLTVSAASGIGFGIWQGYPFHWEKIFDGFPLNILRQSSPALIEEIVFRAGIVHSTFLLFGKVAGLASGSIPFGILHLAGLLFGQSVTTAQIFGISLAGLMLSLIYFRFGILGAFATHLTWNALVGGWINIYGLADRAAAVSALEGSWLTCAVLTLACGTLAAFQFNQSLAVASTITKDFDIDESQLDRNLNLTPEQRLIEHQSAPDLSQHLAHSGQKLHEQSQ